MSGSGKKSNEMTLLLLTAAVVVGVLVFMVIIEPQLKLKKQNIENVNRLKMKLLKMQVDMQIKDRIDKSYSQIEPMISGGEDEQHDISQFTRELSDLYSNLNLKIRSVKILPATKEEFYQRLAIRIEMNGHIRNIVRFINDVETLSNPIRIEKLDLKTYDLADEIDAAFMITKIVTKHQNRV